MPTFSKAAGRRLTMVDVESRGALVRNVELSRYEVLTRRVEPPIMTFEEATRSPPGRPPPRHRAPMPGVTLISPPLSPAGVSAIDFDDDSPRSTTPKRPSLSRLSSSSARVLAFSRLSFSVRDRRTGFEKRLVDDVCGRCERATTTAIMGPSGAGKTTLLRVLTLQAPPGRARGRVTLCGRPLTGTRFRQSCFAVNQDDELWPTLTARETLLWAARCYRAAGAEIEDGRGDELLERLGLLTCADVFVGHAMVPGGLSGGQRRRLSIGAALVNRATCAFLDEPTSGLDAAAALSVTDFMRTLAKEDHLILLATIHQPASEIFLGFDNCMLLSGGRCAYSGTAAAAAAYFGGLGHRLPPLTNPADWLLQLVNADFGAKEPVAALLDAWAGRVEARRAAKDDDAELHRGGVDDFAPIAPSLANQTVLLLRRQALLLSRDVVVVGCRFVAYFLGNLYFAVVFWNSRRRTQPQVVNRMWLLLWLHAVPANLTVVVVFALNYEARLVRSEVRNGLVAPAAYLLARGLLAVPMAVALCAVAIGVPGFGIGNWHAGDGRLLTTSLVWIAQQYCWDAYATLCAVFFSHPLVGTAVYLFAWFNSFLYAGFIIPIYDVQWPMRVMCYVFPIRFSVRSLVWSDFADAEYDACDKYDAEDQFCYCGPDADKSVGCSGRDVLDQISVVFRSISSKNTLLQDVGVILGLAAVANVLACCAFIRGARGSPPPTLDA